MKSERKIFEEMKIGWKIIFSCLDVSTRLVDNKHYCVELKAKRIPVVTMFGRLHVYSSPFSTVLQSQLIMEFEFIC